MERRARQFAKVFGVMAALGCLLAALALTGCLKPTDHKIAAWEIHVTEDRCEEHLFMYAWHDADDDTHVLLFSDDGTYEELGGPALLPTASQATWEVLYCDVDGYTNWNGWDAEKAAEVFAYRVVVTAQLSPAVDITGVYSLEWDGDDLILGGKRFIGEDISANE